MAGRLGIVLFFVISGFIMVYISGEHSFSAWNFLKRRAIRIIPLYWLFTGLAALLAAFLPSLFHTTVFTWPHFLQSLFFIAHEAPERGGASPILSLGWTLNYEAYFYVAFAVVAFLGVTSRVLILTVYFIATWLAGLLLSSKDPVLGFYLNTSPLAFVAGAWIGRSYLMNFQVFDTRAAWPLCFIAVAGLILAFADDGTRLISEVSFAGQLMWAACLVLLSLIAENKLRRLNLLEQLGNASYALYLSHIFVIGAVSYVADRVIGHVYPGTVFLISFISIVASCSTSIVIYNYLEKPLLEVFSGRRNPKSELSSTGATSGITRSVPLTNSVSLEPQNRG
jgi:exopolysaccharide production protein ExoZ